MKKGDIIKDISANEYVVLGRLGKGGQATVWEVQNKKTKVHYAFKLYKNNKTGIKRNLETLQTIGKFKDADGIDVEEVILPIKIVNLEGSSFGYVMEKVDLTNYITLKKAFFGKYPSCEALCRIFQKFAKVFQVLHICYGLCYKDINEGNVFFNPKTGDIKIIDNDNIGPADIFTIKGTPYYMAPEIVLGARPDSQSDKFSLAVYFYRLLIGGYPFEGPYTEEYCKKNNVLAIDAQKVIFGSNPVFVWHPTDKKNSLLNSNNELYKNHIKRWNSLPNSVKALFIKTFATNLPKEKRAERSTEKEWIDTFKEIEKNLVICPKCKKYTFGDVDYCFECSSPIQQKSNPPKPNGANIPVVLPQKHKVKFLVLSLGETKFEKTYNVKEMVDAVTISKHLPAGPLFKILYNKKLDKVVIENLSDLEWIIVDADKSKEICKKGQIIVLEKDMMIKFIVKKAQLNVIDIYK